jgi:hypothetical protein
VPFFFFFFCSRIPTQILWLSTDMCHERLAHLGSGSLPISLSPSPILFCAHFSSFSLFSLSPSSFNLYWNLDECKTLEQLSASCFKSILAPLRDRCVADPICRSPREHSACTLTPGLSQLTLRYLPKYALLMRASRTIHTIWKGLLYYSHLLYMTIIIRLEA